MNEGYAEYQVLLHTFFLFSESWTLKPYLPWQPFIDFKPDLKDVYQMFLVLSRMAILLQVRLT